MWEKIKLWTRITVFSALALYLLIVIAVNWELRVKGTLQLVFIKFDEPRVLLVLLVTALVSIFGWWLTRTVFKAFRQLQSVRERSRTARLEKEMAEMKAKAAMLQKKEGMTPASTAPGFPVTPLTSTGTTSASIAPSDGI
jgi:hypothetical protein